MVDDSDPAARRCMTSCSPKARLRRATLLVGQRCLTGWVVVQEWMDQEGERWLARGWSSSYARWHANGLLHEALYGNWDEDGQ